MIKKAVLASRIRELAAQQGIAIADLEREAGYSPGMVSRWAASGDEDFGALTKLSNVSKRLGVTVDSLLTDKNTEKNSTLETGDSDSTKILLDATIQNRLEWMKLEANEEKKVELLELTKLESANGRAFAEAWQSCFEHCEFIVVAFCDDIQDLAEPIEVALFYSIGNNFPMSRADEDSAPLRTLYVTLRAQNALDHIKSMTQSN